MSDDPKLSQRYRELPREEPPRALDDAILAASRRAVEARPAPLVAPTGRRRWYFPVAAAAVIVLAVAVVAHVDRERPDEEILASSAPAPQTQPSGVEERKAEVPKAAAEAPARPSPRQRRAEAPRQAPPPEGPQFTPDRRADSAPAAAAPAPASRADQRKEIDELRSREADKAAGARAQRAPAPPASTTVPALSRVSPSPEQWLQGIVDLRRQGRHEEADRELAEFRKRYPDYRLSDEMKAKVEKPQ